MAVEAYSFSILFSLNNVFFISWNLVLVLCFHLFSFLQLITMFTFCLILNDYIWCSFLIFELILLMFLLQNRYKSGTLQPKNRFYLCFGYKIGTNHVLLNREPIVILEYWLKQDSNLGLGKLNWIRKPEPIRIRHKYRINLVLWYFGLWVLSGLNPT